MHFICCSQCQTAPNMSIYSSWQSFQYERGEFLTKVLQLFKIVTDKPFLIDLHFKAK